MPDIERANERVRYDEAIAQNKVDAEEIQSLHAKIALLENEHEEWKDGSTLTERLVHGCEKLSKSKPSDIRIRLLS